MGAFKIYSLSSCELCSTVSLPIVPMPYITSPRLIENRKSVPSDHLHSCRPSPTPALAATMFSVVYELHFCFVFQIPHTWEWPKRPFPDGVGGARRGANFPVSALFRCGVSGNLMAAVNFCANWWETDGDIKKILLSTLPVLQCSLGHYSSNKLQRCLSRPFLSLKKNNQTVGGGGKACQGRWKAYWL